MSEKEFRLVTRQETFNDLAVRELAKTRSACICRLQYGRCTEADCKTCSVAREYSSCHSQMNDYDKQRLMRYVSDNYAHDSLFPSQWMSYNNLKKHILKWIFIVLLCMIMMLSPFLLFAETDYNSMIINTLKESQSAVYDLNKDGIINCIDYSVMFKLTWDKKYNEESYRCKIVRNKSETMHHLFVIIFDDYSEMIEVEPWAVDIYRYTMSENWGDKYDPKYNIYGETYRWLKEVK